MRPSSRRVELVVDHDAPARIAFDIKVEAFHVVHSLWRGGQDRPQAVDSVNPIYKKPSSHHTHHLLRPVPCGFCRDDVPPILLLDREKLRA